MSLLLWVILGLVAGYIASRIVNGTGRDVFYDIVIGMLGAVFGGWLFNSFGMTGVVGFNVYSLMVAVIGATVLLVIYHLIFRRGPMINRW